MTDSFLADEDELSSPLVILAGGEGAGKTTFGINLIKECGGLLARVEDGDQAYRGKGYNRTKVAPKPTNETPELFITWFTDLIDYAADNLKKGDTIVIDSLTAVAQRLEQTVCCRYGVESLTKAGGGYGAGWSEVKREFIEIADELDWLRGKGIGVWWLAHLEVAQLKDDPTIEAVNVYNLAVDKRIAAVARQRAQAILAVMTDIIVAGIVQDKTGKVTQAGRVQKSSKRSLITDASTPAFTALCKNRFRLGSKLDFYEGDLSILDNIDFYCAD